MRSPRLPRFSLPAEPLGKVVHKLHLALDRLAAFLSGPPGPVGQLSRPAIPPPPHPPKDLKARKGGRK